MIKRITAPRKRRPGKRRGPWRSKMYRVWIARHFSIMERIAEPGLLNPEPISDPHHTQNNGTSSKGPDWTCVPLTHEEHLEYHAIGRKAFERKYGVDMKALAAKYYARYLDETGMETGSRP